MTPEELVAWASEITGADPHEYVLGPGEFTVNSLAASYDPPVSYTKARRVVDVLRATGAVGRKKVRMNGKSTAVYWRLEDGEIGRPRPA